MGPAGLREPSRASPASYFVHLPQASHPEFPPKRLPRRAVRGLGAHSPHQTSPFLPTDLCEEPKFGGALMDEFNNNHVLIRPCRKE